MWVFDKAIVNGDECTVTYTQTIDGVVEVRTVLHTRASFPTGELTRGVQAVLTPQTDVQWHANIKREIVADLAGYNKVLPSDVDITNKVS